MDLEEWEVLPRDSSFFDFHDDGGGKRVSPPAKSSPRRRGGSSSSSSTPSPNYSSMTPNYSVVDMNYFICPSPSPPKSSISRVVLPIELEPADHPSPPQDEKEQQHQQVSDDCSSSTRTTATVMMVIPKISNRIPNLTGSAAAAVASGDQDSVSQVFFKKMKENEFVDMKLDSPKSLTKSSSSSSLLSSPRFDAGKFGFEDNSCGTNDPSLEKEGIGWDEEGSGDGGNGSGSGLSLWKWSLHGVGAICSFGVAAATVCIIVIFGNHQRNKQQQREQQIRFQIYTDDKRVKQVVQQATRFNDAAAISAVRGVPIARAQVTFGGYYDGI